MHELYFTVSFLYYFIIASSIYANLNNNPVLNGSNFKKWKEHVMIVLGCMDLDYALREDRPALLTSSGTANQKGSMEKWERSNRMSQMIMKHSIPDIIRGAIPEENDDKKFLTQIADRFAANEKVETSTILNKLVSKRYKKKGNIREYQRRIYAWAVAQPTFFSDGFSETVANICDGFIKTVADVDRRRFYFKQSLLATFFEKPFLIATVVLKTVVHQCLSPIKSRPFTRMRPNSSHIL